jgi:hypothetical protein
LKERNLTVLPRLSIVNFLIFFGRKASADTRAPYPDSTDRVFCWSTLLGY